MAKKAVAGYRDASSKDGRNYTKVIRVAKSPKTGAYTFKEEMVPNETVKDYFTK